MMPLPGLEVAIPESSARASVFLAGPLGAPLLVAASEQISQHIQGMTDRLAQLRGAISSAYEIEREIGRGGMATVWLARDLKHKRAVALKVLDEDLVGVETLLVPERADLHRLGHDRRVGRDLARRILEIGGDTVEQKRSVILSSQAAPGGALSCCSCGNAPF